MVDNSSQGAVAGRGAPTPRQQVVSTPVEARAPDIAVSHARTGYDDISTVYAYYTAEQKARHGKHCESWTEFGHRPETAPYCTGQERAFIAKIDAENLGKFDRFLISWSGSD